MSNLKSHYATRVAWLATLATVFLVGGGNKISVFAAENGGETAALAAADDGRPIYTEETRPDFPVFNSLPDQEHFVTITGPDGQVVKAGSEPAELQLGQEYEIKVDYCNNGLPQGVRTKAIANETRVLVDFPYSIGNERQLKATIVARDSNPKSVSCTLTLVAAAPMDLEPIAGSAEIVNQNQTNGSLIALEELLDEGAYIGTNSMTGIVVYGEENAGSVVFRFRTVPTGEGRGITFLEDDTAPITHQTATPSQPTASPKADGVESGFSPLVVAAIAFCGIIAVISLIYIFKTIREACS